MSLLRSYRQRRTRVGAATAVHLVRRHRVLIARARLEALGRLLGHTIFNADKALLDQAHWVMLALYLSLKVSLGVYPARFPVYCRTKSTALLQLPSHERILTG